MFKTIVTPEGLAADVTSMKLSADEAVLILLAESGCPDLEDLVSALNTTGAKFLGGIFPGLIAASKKEERGAVLLRLPISAAPILVRDLNEENPTIPAIQDIVTSSATDGHTAIVFVDGLSASVSRCLTLLQQQVGQSISYMGGGAGSISLQQQPCVFTHEGVAQDAAVVALVPKQCRLSVRHGWKRHSGPFVATRTEGNTIFELNWRPAFEVYKEAIEPHIDTTLTPENVFTASTAFPFGIHKEGREDVVRDPVGIGDFGELICVGEVPQNAVVDILHGKSDTLISAASKVGEDLMKGGRIEGGIPLVIDCVSRTMFLNDKFEHELKEITDRIISVSAVSSINGALTLGEISSDGSGFVEFLNKTIVAAVLHE